jgi:hypothetical protein
MCIMNHFAKGAIYYFNYYYFNNFLNYFRISLHGVQNLEPEFEAGICTASSKTKQGT